MPMSVPWIMGPIKVDDSSVEGGDKPINGGRTIAAALPQWQAADAEVQLVDCED
jgi:hypothetical protein